MVSFINPHALAMPVNKINGVFFLLNFVCQWHTLCSEIHGMGVLVVYFMAWDWLIQLWFGAGGRTVLPFRYQ